MCHRARLPPECLHFLSVSPPCSHPRPLLSLIPSGILSRARSRFPPPSSFSLFLPDEFNSCRRQRERTFNLPPLSAEIGEVAFAYRFRCAFNLSRLSPLLLPKEHSFTSFQYHVHSRRFCPGASLRVILNRPRMEGKRVSISSARPCTCRGRKSRIIGGTCGCEELRLHPHRPTPLFLPPISMIISKKIIFLI